MNLVFQNDEFCRNDHGLCIQNDEMFDSPSRRVEAEPRLLSLADTVPDPTQTFNTRILIFE